jgi:hypothetical protein
VDMAQVTIDASAAYIRLALRVYFTVVLLLIGFIGDQCCAMRVRLKIARDRRVAIPQMTGWLSGWGTVQAFWSFRTAPAGWLGYLMLIASLLWLSSDLAVSGLVTTVEIPGRCPFSTKGPHSVFTVERPFVYRRISSAGPLYDLISQAQITSIRNGGLGGIYAKVNDDPNFRADPKDILGQWRCNDTGVIKPTFEADILPQYIQGNLTSGSYLFNQTNCLCGGENTNGHGVELTTGLLLLSASQSSYPLAPWDVRAAIDLTIPENQTKIFKLYECSMDAPSVEWLLAQVQPDVVLEGWCEQMQGYIFGSAENRGSVIASSLNNIMTNAGASWNNTGEPIIIEDPTQGCLAPQALVSWPVLLLFSMVSVAFFGILGYLVFLAVALYFFVRPSLSPSVSSASYSGKSKSEQPPPSGHLTWMHRAVQETPQGRDATLKSLKKWSFGRGLSGDLVILASQPDEDLENNEDGERLISKGCGDSQPRKCYNPRLGRNKHTKRVALEAPSPRGREPQEQSTPKTLIAPRLEPREPREPHQES